MSFIIPEKNFVLCQGHLKSINLTHVTVVCFLRWKLRQETEQKPSRHRVYERDGFPSVPSPLDVLKALYFSEKCKCYTGYSKSTHSYSFTTSSLGSLFFMHPRVRERDTLVGASLVSCWQNRIIRRDLFLWIFCHCLFLLFGEGGRETLGTSLIVSLPRTFTFSYLITHSQGDKRMYG